MRIERWNTVAMATILLGLALGLGACSSNKPVRTYVSGWDGTDLESREQLAELERAGRLQLVDQLESSAEVDYVVLAPLPNREEASVAESREVLGRMEWFAMLNAHSDAQAMARERNIPLVELPEFFRMVEAGETQRREK
ncbi:MAG: hypothetical protein WD294_08730 [Phycisphaeraceae bacterium]